MSGSSWQKKVTMTPKYASSVRLDTVCQVSEEGITLLDKEEYADRSIERKEKVAEEGRKGRFLYRSKYLENLSGGCGHHFDYRTFAGRGKIWI